MPNNIFKLLFFIPSFLFPLLWYTPLQALNPLERELFPKPTIDTLPGFDLSSRYIVGWKDDAGNQISSGASRGSTGIRLGSLMIEAWGEVSNTTFRWKYPFADVDAAIGSEAAGFRLTYMDRAGASFWIERERPYMSMLLMGSTPSGVDVEIEMGLGSAFKGAFRIVPFIKSMGIGSDLLTSSISAQIIRPRWEMAISLGAGSSVYIHPSEEVRVFNYIPLAWSAASNVTLRHDAFTVALSALADGATVSPIPAALKYLASDQIEFSLLSGGVRLTTTMPFSVDMVLSHLSMPGGEGFFYAKSFSYLLGPFIGDGMLRWSGISATRAGGSLQGRFVLAGITLLPTFGIDALWLNAEASIHRKKREWVSDGFFFWQGHEVVSWPSVADADFGSLPDGFIHGEIAAECPIGKHQFLSIGIRQYIPVSIPKQAEYGVMDSISMEQTSGYGGLVCSLTWKWKP